jgi:inner membrane protein
MPTALTHTAVPLAIRVGLGDAIPPRLLAAGIGASMLPDIDVVAFRLGIPYAADLGHRGFTHSLAFALMVAAAGGAAHRLLHSRFAPAAAFLLLAVASHAPLDALTNGGLGVAWLWPISSERFFAPVRPIQVAPISVRALLSPRGVAVIASEFVWVWLPCAVVSALLASVRGRRQ